MWTLCVLAAGLISVLAAQSTNALPGETNSFRAAAVVAGDTVVGPEDTVTIQALDAEEISKPWRVSTAGELNLPMIGRLQAGGVTIRELEREITDRLKKFLHNPQVSVFISESRSQPVTVTGAVIKPGVMQLAGSKSLLDVLIMSGGPSKENSPTVTVTRKIQVAGEIPMPSARRETNGQFSVVELNLKEVMSGEGPGALLQMAPFDVVTVSEPRQPRMVHVTGEVVKPGAIELVTQDSISMMKALAMAGGSTRTAKPEKAMILHVNPDGTQTAAGRVNLKQIMSGKVRDIELIPGDILIVPSSVIGAYMQTAAQSAISGSIWMLGRL